MSITAGAGDPADPGTSFKLLLSCPSGLPASQVFVNFDASYDRIPHPDASLEESINEIWNQRIQGNPSLYSGLKFRYGDHTVQYADGSDQISSICLHLGLTDYRSFVGTNLNPLWERFLFPPADDSLCCQHTSSPLGNGAIVETSDGKILILQRSHNVGEFPGYFVFPGGHSEPQEIGISSHCTDKSTIQSDLINQKVCVEMFDGIVREVVEEIGVPANTLSNPLFIGISRRVTNARPTAFFFLRCNLPAEEVCEFYSKAQDGFESTQIFTVSRDDLKKLALKMPGCHCGGLALYELMMESDLIHIKYLMRQTSECLKHKIQIYCSPYLVALSLQYEVPILRGIFVEEVCTKLHRERCYLLHGPIQWRYSTIFGSFGWLLCSMGLLLLNFQSHACTRSNNTFSPHTYSKYLCFSELNYFIFQWGYSLKYAYKFIACNTNES